jgi:hypothetical protein
MPVAPATGGAKVGGWRGCSERKVKARIGVTQVLEHLPGKLKAQYH